MMIKKNVFGFFIFFVMGFHFLSFANNLDKKKVKIAFVLLELSFRGVEVSTFDYADFNETLLGNESIIINFDVHTDNDVRKKFTTRFPGRFFDCISREYMDYILSQEQVDILYFQKAGHNDGMLSTVCKNVVHAVFPGMIQPHGDVYAFISEWFVHQFPQLDLPYVPYIVRVEETNENLRKELNIPQEAIVFGRHGGFESFNVPCARDAVKAVAASHKDIYFLFLNTQEFCNLPNVIFLPKTTNMLYKAKFINTCDAMIHARWRGETFGLACAEFSIKNKPVITWIAPKERSHIELLAGKGIYYYTKDDLVKILCSFKREPDKNFNAYGSKFTPEAVMKKFDELFIRPFENDLNKIKKENRKLLFRAVRKNNSVNPEFLEHICQIFGINVLVKEGAGDCNSLAGIAKFFKRLHLIELDPISYKQVCARFKEYNNMIIHEKVLSSMIENNNIFGQNERALLFLDCHWRSFMQKTNYPVYSVFEQLQILDRAPFGSVVIVIDGVHLLDGVSIEAIFHRFVSMKYQFFIFNDSIIAFADNNIFVDPLIRAMTVSWLCEINHFAKNKTLQELLFSEHLIARTLSNEQAMKAEFDSFSPPFSFASRYYHLWNGLALLQQGDYENAALIFQMIINQGYGHWRLYWYLGQAWHKMGNVEAENAVMKVANDFPNFYGVADFKKAISY